MDDHALLQEELHWRSRPGRRRRPPGANAITALGLVITLVLWGVTGVVMTPLFSGPKSSGVIDPSAIVVIVVFGVEMLIAVVISSKVWIAIGPSARGVLRPFGVLGPLPMLVFAFFALVMAASIVAAPFMPKKARPPTAGKNWQVVRTSERWGATYGEAEALCKNVNGRIPQEEEIARFDPPWPNLATVWLEWPTTERMPRLLNREGRVTSLALQPGQEGHAFVVCFR